MDNNDLVKITRITTYHTTQGQNLVVTERYIEVIIGDIFGVILWDYNLTFKIYLLYN